jgi:LysM repeat protein
LTLNRHIEAVIFYHSASGKIFSGADTTHSATLQLAKMMAEATGYRHAPEGVPGQVTTGDAIDWLSTHGIAATEIELTTHQDIEWERNLRGILAFIKWSIPGRSPVVTLVPTGELPGNVVYTVQPGDTLGAISLRYNVSVQDIVRANGLSNEDVIVTGQPLLIPVRMQGDKK